MDRLTERFKGRHPATVALLLWLEVNQNLPDSQRRVATVFETTAADVTELVKDGPELSTALRRLIEAKDCAVRQSLLDENIIVPA